MAAQQKFACQVCGAEIEVPSDVVDGEIVSCPSCGTRYVVRLVNGTITLEEFKGDVEDYGE